MSTKTYRGSSLEECFTKVKSDMGGDAIILTSRAVQPIFGRFGKKQHEVTATLDEPVMPQSKPRPPMEHASGAETGRGVYGYSRGSGSADRSEGASGRRSQGTSAKLRMVEMAPRRAIEIAEARASELRSEERKGIEVRGLVEGRRIELRGEDDETPPRRPTGKSLRDHLSFRESSTIESGDGKDGRIAKLEAQVLTLETSMQIVREAIAGRGKAGKAGPSTAQQIAATESKPGYAALRKALVDAGVVEPLVRRMVDGLAEGLTDSDATEALRTVIAGRILLAGPIEPLAGAARCLAFIGPTGAGKTTTLAKMAARLTLVDHCRVAIITTDTQRVAAAKQIEIFGEILRVPVKVAYDVAELTQHYEEFAAQGFDFILVDTAGKSPNDSIAIGEVARMLKGLPMLTKYLTVPATLSGANHDFVTGKFFSLALPDAVVLTKCDESADMSHYGHLLTAQAKFSVPIAYVAEGARVPDDLTPADAHAIAAKLLGS